MTSDKKKSCLLCHSTEFKTIFSYNEPDQYERAVGIGKEGYMRQWVRCRDCNFVYQLFSRPEDALDHIYVSAYRSGDSSWRKKTTEETFNHVISLPKYQTETDYRIRWIKSQVQTLRDSGFVLGDGPPYRMLDVGGATGVFAYEFRDNDWLPHVIDPSKDGLFIQKKYGIPYAEKYYEPGHFGLKFDLISLIFVLEHHRDPMSLLNNVRLDMGKNSILYIEVPDALCFRYKPPDDDIFNSCHLWMFDPQTLLELLSMCGFEALSMQRMKTIRGHYALLAMGGHK